MATTLITLLLVGVWLGGVEPCYLVLMKCCEANEVLNSNGSTCVPVPWRPYDVYIPPLIFITSKHPNASWLQRWVPPGLPQDSVMLVRGHEKNTFAALSRIVPVRSAFCWEEGKTTKDDLQQTERAFFYWQAVMQSTPAGILAYEDYCVDAVQAPFPAPFALRLPPLHCREGVCVRKCCYNYLKRPYEDGSIQCEFNETIQLENKDPRTMYCVNGMKTIKRFTSTDASPAFVEGWLSTTTTCVDTDVHGPLTLQDDGHHFVVHCEEMRFARAAYWCARPLSFIAILLLVAALATIASKQRMRSSVHGWALACHAGCLLVFNITQVAFYLSIGDQVDASDRISEVLQGTCLVFAFFVYFLLTAAACWLTAVCWNLSTGFSTTRLQLPGGERRKFLQLSAFAWGTPTLLTVACISVYVTNYDSSMAHYPPWYTPNLLETRTCFREAELRGEGFYNLSLESRKEGTTLFFYGPIATLCIVNMGCIVKAMRAVHFLRRGNSVLKRGGQQKGRDHGHNDTSLLSMEGKRKIYQRKDVSMSEPKSATVYIRLILGAGAVELTTEMAAWAASRYSFSKWSYLYFSAYPFVDQSLAFRAVGYFADLLRASIVLWLAAPEVGDLSAFWRQLGPIWWCLKQIWLPLREIWKRLQAGRHHLRS